LGSLPLGFQASPNYWNVLLLWSRPIPTKLGAYSLDTVEFLVSRKVTTKALNRHCAGR